MEKIGWVVFDGTMIHVCYIGRRLDFGIYLYLEDLVTTWYAEASHRHHHTKHWVLQYFTQYVHRIGLEDVWILAHLFVVWLGVTWRHNFFRWRSHIFLISSSITGIIVFFSWKMVIWWHAASSGTMQAMYGCFMKLVCWKFEGCGNFFVRCLRYGSSTITQIHFSIK